MSNHDRGTPDGEPLERTAAYDPVVPPVLDIAEADPSDTTTILHGAKAVIGKAVWSVNRMAVAVDAIAAYDRAKQVREEREAQDARELAHLAEWNKQRTTVFGVEMSNAEAQEARQRVIENDESYAKWAVDQGHISESEKDDFKRGVRRKHELEDKRGRGTITGAEEREGRDFDRSRVGRATEAATAESHLAWKRDHGIAATRSDANADLRTGEPAPAPVSEAVFQNTRDITAPASATRALPVVERNIAPSVEATGLNL
jgi:hypothetical protein